MGNDMVEHIEVVETGAADRFPATSSGRLSEAARAAQSEAAALSAWSESQGRLDPVAFRSDYTACRAALTANPDAAVGHVRSHDGQDMIIQSGALDEDRRRSLLVDGGGVLLSSVERLSPELNRMVGHLSVARGARVTAVALFGSEPTRVLGPQVDKTTVLAVSGDVVVHPGGGPPFDLTAGTGVTVDAYPRVMAGPESFTVLFLQSAFTPAVRQSVLLDRALGHPLLRLDAPVEITEPTEMYGSSEPVAYAEVVADQVQLLIENSPDDLLQWWWVLGHRMPPFAVPIGSGSMTVRGRFPGGVGMVEGTEGQVVKGAGHSFLVPERHRELCVNLIAGAAFPIGPDDPGFRSVLNMLSVGAVEVVP